MKSPSMSSAFTHDSSKCIKVFLHKRLNSLIIIFFKGIQYFDAILIKIDAVEYSLSRSVWVMQMMVEILKTQNFLWLTSSLKYTEKSPNPRDIFCARPKTFYCVSLCYTPGGRNTCHKVQVFHSHMIFVKWQLSWFLLSNIMWIYFSAPAALTRMKWIRVI